MENLTKAIGILREGGPSELLKRGVPYAYNKYIVNAYNKNIVPLLPRTNTSYNGIDVNAARYFDAIIPWRQKNEPYYESGLVSGIEEYVREGDDVVIVGGGWGVTAVKAAQNVGSSGKVTVYEGADKQVKYVQETTKKHNVSDRVNIIHGIVGPKICLNSEEKNAARVSPEQLPECDVLELDCEGAEIEILENLTIRPRVILVESHGIHDASSSKVEGLLNELSYSVKSKEVADRGREKSCLHKDVYTLAAVQE